MSGAPPKDMDSWFKEFERLVDSYQTAAWAEKKQEKEAALQPKPPSAPPAAPEDEDEEMEKYMSIIKEEE